MMKNTIIKKGDYLTDSKFALIDEIVPSVKNAGWVVGEIAHPHNTAIVSISTSSACYVGISVRIRKIKINILNYHTSFYGVATISIYMSIIYNSLSDYQHAVLTMQNYNKDIKDSLDTARKRLNKDPAMFKDHDSPEDVETVLFKIPGGLRGLNKFIQKPSDKYKSQEMSKYILDNEEKN